METQKLNFANRLLNIFDTNELKNNRISENEEKSFQRVSIEKFTQMGLPTVKNEEWKYTNLGFLNRGDFKYSFDNNLNNLELSKLEEKIKPIILSNSNHITFVNGLFCEKLSNLSELEKGLNLMNLSIEETDTTIKYFSELQELHKLESKQEVIKDNPFELLFDGFPTQNLLIEVANKSTLNKILQVIYLYDDSFDNYISLNRNYIKINSGSSLELVENYIGYSENVISFNKTEIFIDKNSQLTHTKIQNFENNNIFNFGNIYQKRDSVYTNNTFSLTGNFLRNNLKTILLEDNCESHFNGLSIINDNNLVDHHTKVDHYSPNCNSNEFYKTILFDNSTGVFNGKILVRKDAQKTNAYQSSKNLILSDNAKMNTKPELEIYADDVKCSHGASTGKIDEEALFYLQARGIGLEYGKILLLFAFAEDVVERVKNDEIVNYINSIIKLKLNYNL